MNHFNMIYSTIVEIHTSSLYLMTIVIFGFLSVLHDLPHKIGGARCSSVVRAFAHGAMGRRIDPSWGGPIELFLVPTSAPRLV